MIVRWLRVALVELVAALLGLAPTTRTLVKSYTYDDHATAHVDAFQIEPAKASAAALNAPKACVSPSLQTRYTSTIPSAPVVATNTVRPGTDLVKYEAYPPAARRPRSTPKFRSATSKQSTRRPTPQHRTPREHHVRFTPFINPSKAKHCQPLLFLLLSNKKTMKRTAHPPDHPLSATPATATKATGLTSGRSSDERDPAPRPGRRRG
jgi:hypothetical protein